ncbi:spore germination protein [Peribacillus frigoritolerans]|nr:spore germination protein [Peribacillus frigoritolerans]
MLDGSPHAVVGPNTIISFFSSFEDYFQIWNLGTSFRLIRLFAVLFSVLSSPLYVAVLTYHYQVIPTDLLPILISSRGADPFSADLGSDRAGRDDRIAEGSGGQAAC